MDWSTIVGDVGGDQYGRRIQQLRGDEIDTSEIESTVEAALTSFNDPNEESFVIYGEPQSGKTEMMIALNARLIDEGCDVIINLLTDSVELLNQSLSRFRQAGLSPSPKQFSELPTDAQTLKGKQWVIFSKKNARDLQKLSEALRFVQKLVIIDDEADYASPNAKVNRDDERTRINEMIHGLIEGRGRYIGVTATPARLDLNNTFDNDTEKWVSFKPHTEYVGQDFFFPDGGVVDYRLYQFPADQGDERRKLRDAILHFLCGVAEQHQQGKEENFTMLVHTSGKTDEHNADVAVISNTIATLSDGSHRSFASRVKALEKIAPAYNAADPNSIVEFVLRRINRHQVVEVNYKGKKKSNVSDLLNPTSLFSFGAGGNIISRGVTFKNLLSMYFTRSVKGKFSQDTYIQRARMFGARQDYKKEFQLWIPDTLMQNWSKCFAFHKLAVDAVTSGRGAPVWLSDLRTTPTSPASIDRSSVDFEGGEMSFGLFDYDRAIHESLMTNDVSDVDKLQALRDLLGEEYFPDYVADYIARDIGTGGVCFHRGSQFGGGRSKYTKTEVDTIRRKKGIFSNNEFKRGNRPEARHHLKIFFNHNGKARLFYKINGAAVRFIQNRR